MELPRNIIEFKSSPEIRAKLTSYGTSKTFIDGDVIRNKYSNIKAGESCIMSFLGGMHHQKSKVMAIVKKSQIINYYSFL